MPRQLYLSPGGSRDGSRANRPWRGTAEWPTGPTAPTGQIIQAEGWPAGRPATLHACTHAPRGWFSKTPPPALHHLPTGHSPQVIMPGRRHAPGPPRVRGGVHAAPLRKLKRRPGRVGGGGIGAPIPPSGRAALHFGTHVPGIGTRWPSRRSSGASKRQRGAEANVKSAKSAAQLTGEPRGRRRGGEGRGEEDGPGR